MSQFVKYKTKKLIIKFIYYIIDVTLIIFLVTLVYTIFYSKIDNSFNIFLLLCVTN